MNVFEDIKLGLNQAIEHEKGIIKAKSTVLEITPLESFEPKEIKQIRLQTGLTQKNFAAFLGVSVKTIEAWECGRNHPDGTACRMLSFTKNNPSFPQTSGIVRL